MHIRKALSPSEKSTSTTPPAEEKKEDEDERVLNEIEELTNAMDRKKKRAKKLLAKRQAKDKARKALGKQTDAMEDGYIDQELFSLTSIKGKKDLVAVENNEYEDDIDDVRNSESEDSHDEAEGYTSSDVDSEEDRKRYNEHVDELLDEAYERFVSKKEGNTEQRKRSKQTYTYDDQLLKGDDSMVHSDQDSDNEKNEPEANPLVLPLKEYALTQEELASQWFSQDVFMDADEHEELEKDDSEDDMPIDKPVEHHRVPGKKIEDSFEEPIGQTEKCQSQMTQSSKVEDGFE